MPDLIESLKAMYPISAELEYAIRSKIQPKALTKQQIILKPGQTAYYIYFIEHGLARGYSLKEGREISTWFMREGDFVISVASFLTQIPSTEYIQLLENTNLQSISYESLQQLYAEFPEFNIIGRLITEHYYILSEQRTYALRALSAKERYKQLLEDFPDIISRVAIKDIASYLGIAPETLSRIRASY